MTTKKKGMVPALKTKWLKALRGGRYKQGAGYLESSGGSNCCLGVLCRVARMPIGNKQMMLTSSQLKKLGLTYGQANTLARKNDTVKSGNHENDYAVTHENPFGKIADYIEKRL